MKVNGCAKILSSITLVAFRIGQIHFHSNHHFLNFSQKFNRKIEQSGMNAIIIQGVVDVVNFVVADEVNFVDDDNAALSSEEKN